MSGWLDSLFGNLPPPPSRPPMHPASRGATFGAKYQDMPMPKNMEVRSIADFSVPPATDIVWKDKWLGPSVPQWLWQKKNIPDNLPTTPLADPNLPLDPSIMAAGGPQGAAGFARMEQHRPAGGPFPVAETGPPMSVRFERHDAQLRSVGAMGRGNERLQRFKTQIAEYANRQDWSDALVTGFVRQSEQKFNSELRVDRMIKTSQNLVNCRCLTCLTTGCRWTW